MKKIFLFIFLLLMFFIGHCQKPNIVIGHVCDTADNSPLLISGLFFIDSICDIGSAFLITVITGDSVTTNGSELLFGSLKTPGVPFTVISFKNNSCSKGRTIRKGNVYRFTLSPPGGAWSLYGWHKDDSNCFLTAIDEYGDTINIPCSMIQTQLMMSLELSGLQYNCINSNFND
ncbi:MAG: hypothetical protein II670_13030 [Alphaproteobacteria bacterium]|nr:hypothetical protein [Alphaproteobacteria bacterium]